MSRNADGAHALDMSLVRGYPQDDKGGLMAETDDEQDASANTQGQGEQRTAEPWSLASGLHRPTQALAGVRPDVMTA